MPLSCLLCSYFQREEMWRLDSQFRIWKEEWVDISLGNPCYCSPPFGSHSSSDLNIALWLALKSN